MYMLTVKELKTRLAQLPEDKEIFASSEDGEDEYGILSVGYFDNQVWISLVLLADEEED